MGFEMKFSPLLLPRASAEGTAINQELMAAACRVGYTELWGCALVLFLSLHPRVCQASHPNLCPPLNSSRSVPAPKHGALRLSELPRGFVGKMSDVLQVALGFMQSQ